MKFYEKFIRDLFIKDHCANNKDYTRINEHNDFVIPATRDAYSGYRTAFEKYSSILFYKSHYDWLDDNLDIFWYRVFGKTLHQSGCAGIISAHADKCYQYRAFWEKSGIDFYHGVAVYLLTYTKEFGNNNKSDSSYWVVNNFSKYKDKLPLLYKTQLQISNLVEETSNTWTLNTLVKNAEDILYNALLEYKPEASEQELYNTMISKWKKSRNE